MAKSLKTYKKVTEMREKALDRAIRRMKRLSKKEAADTSPEELYALRDALDQQLAARPVEQVAASLPDSSFRQDVIGIAEGSSQQRESALRSAVLGGLSGGALGAGVGVPIRGSMGALVGGLTGVVPGAISGYYVGKKRQRRHELKAALDKALSDYEQLQTY